MGTVMIGRVERRTLCVDVTCGETTCAAEPGVFCRFLRVGLAGKDPTCVLFDERIFDESGNGIAGWLQRCDACLEAEGEGEVM